jgi:O-antigen ligase
VVLRVLQVGALAVVLVVSTLHVFELDRFFVPKELVLHVTAVIGGIFAARSIARAGMTRVDLLLIGCILLSAISAAFATNPWVAIRAVAITASGTLLFWMARAMREAGLGRSLVRGLALAVVAVAITSLTQAYGFETSLFSENRAPGGTLGNRNFVAHVCAFGLPLLLFVTLNASGSAGVMLGAIGTSIATATLVLTRSRAAWLAFAAVVAVFVLATLISPLLRREGRTWRRLALTVVFAGAGVAAALVVPNTLRWRSDNPYLETLERVADYQEGSGRGRLVQYTQSLAMAARYPIFGVGPGNWAVQYPDHARRGDPSLSDSESGVTTNPWPSSDWVAWISERGFLATIVLALVFLLIAVDSFQGLRNIPAEAGAPYVLATIAGAVIAGMFDAVLLLAVPTFLVWAALGALWKPERIAPRKGWGLAVIAVMVISTVGAVRSGAQLTAMHIQVTRGDRASLERASAIDPGSYRLHLRLARMGRREWRCQHARAARALFPHSGAAAEVSRGCGR